MDLLSNFRKSNTLMDKLGNYFKIKKLRASLLVPPGLGISKISAAENLIEYKRACLKSIYTTARGGNEYLKPQFECKNTVPKANNYLWNLFKEVFITTHLFDSDDEFSNKFKNRIVDIINTDTNEEYRPSSSVGNADGSSNLVNSGTQEVLAISTEVLIMIWY
jgi:hypothetical protein